MRNTAPLTSSFYESLANGCEFRAHTQFRRAQLQAKHNAEAAKRKERELLFASVQEGSAPSSLGRRKGQEKLTPDQLELNASNDLTSGLKRLLQLGESEVAKSQFAVDTLGRF